MCECQRVCHGFMWSLVGAGKSGRAKEEPRGLGFKVPTNVQRVAVPVLLQGHDAFIKSQTGSGKTLTYLLPLVNILLSQPTRVQRADGTQAIILAPTRELASQIVYVRKQGRGGQL